MDKCKINHPYMVKTENMNVILFSSLCDAKTEYAERIKKYPGSQSALLKMKYVKHNGIWYSQNEVIVSHVPTCKKHPKIEQVNSNGEVVAVFSDTTMARLSVGQTNTKGINRAIRNNCKCGGFFWRLQNTQNNITE